MDRLVRRHQSTHPASGFIGRNCTPSPFPSRRHRQSGLSCTNSWNLNLQSKLFAFSRKQCCFSTECPDRQPHEMQWTPRINQAPNNTTTPSFINVYWDLTFTNITSIMNMQLMTECSIAKHCTLQLITTAIDKFGIRLGGTACTWEWRTRQDSASVSCTYLL